MRIGVLAGRSVLVKGDRAVDIAKASDGRFGPEPMETYERWHELATWVRDLTDPGEPFDQAELQLPVPAPRQVFGVGANYADHIAEARAVTPDRPLIFTKFLSSIAGPFDPIPLPSRKVDWEVELVVVIGRHGHRVDEADAWNHVAGLTVGQDVSERVMQLAGPNPQFSMGKSFPAFGPIGPLVVSADEFENPEDLAIGCEIDGEQVQHSRTSQLIFSIPNLIARISSTVPLMPGDLIFTGTPSGVGVFRTPRRFLRAGEILTSWVEGIGQIVNPIIDAHPHATKENDR